MSGEEAVSPLLEVRDLATHIVSRRGVVRSVDGVSFSVDRGRSLCIVGESGSGKSMTAKSIMRLLPAGAAIVRGSVELDGQDLVGCSERTMRGVRGRRVSMLFQDPMTSLNPVLTIGTQIVETIRAHRKVSRAEARDRAVALLEEVKISDAAKRLGSTPTSTPAECASV
ncbi:MAG: ATP-binding cassette domain-containing protein [Nocardioides sp.]